MSIEPKVETQKGLSFERIEMGVSSVMICMAPAGVETVQRSAKQDDKLGGESEELTTDVSQRSDEFRC